MGCASSRRIDLEERVQKCKERKRLMKQLLVLRSEFAASQLAYLKSLKNTGVTLRQFIDVESLEQPEHSPSLDPATPASPPPPPPPPPPPLLPPPPPPPHLISPKNINGVDEEEKKGNSRTSLTPPILSSSWDAWDPFCGASTSYSSPIRLKKTENVAQRVEEEDWEETNTEFEEEGEEEGGGGKEKEENKRRDKQEIVQDDVINCVPENPLSMEMVDDSSSVASWCDKDSEPKSSNKTLPGIIKEIDDYFLKAYASGRDIVLLLDINCADTPYQNSGESMRKNGKSAKVFSAFSWSRSFKSFNSNKDATEFHESTETCKPGAHCNTLDNIYAEEERLYKEVKEEESTKLEYERKMLLLQKQQNGDQDMLKTEDIRTSIESLEDYLISLQESISKSCSTLARLRDEELHPQLIELSSRMMHMWRTMQECHQAQSHIAQQMSHLTLHSTGDPTSDYHHQATIQLESEVNAWFNNFCNLFKSQCEYVKVLNRWVQFTDGLLEGKPQNDQSDSVFTLCEAWQHTLDRLHSEVASEAIKRFAFMVHSMVLQQTEEFTLLKKSERLDKKFQKELHSLLEMEKKFEGSLSGESVSSLSPNHPLTVKRAKVEASRKRVDEETAKYMNSVQVSEAMTLETLEKCLPNVFKALTRFSGECAQGFDAVHGFNRTSITTTS